MRPQPFSRLTLRPPSWLWPGRLALGKLAMLNGDPGLGKSLPALDRCPRLSTGHTTLHPIIQGRSEKTEGPLDSGLGRWSNRGVEAGRLAGAITMVHSQKSRIAMSRCGFRFE